MLLLLIVMCLSSEFKPSLASHRRAKQTRWAARHGVLHGVSVMMLLVRSSDWSRVAKKAEERRETQSKLKASKPERQGR
jgi:hypothetical protein